MELFLKMPGNRIKHNDLLPWFTDDHGTLPKAYLESCRKFFEEISNKQQAASLPQLNDKKNYENK